MPFLGFTSLSEILQKLTTSNFPNFNLHKMRLELIWIRYDMDCKYEYTSFLVVNNSAKPTGSSHGKQLQPLQGCTICKWCVVTLDICQVAKLL